MEKIKYTICTRCIMDTSDPEIRFDDSGVCSHCRRYVSLINDESYLQKKKPGALEKLVNKIKAEGKAKQYDCIIGLSGGVDSTYTAFVVKELGLRPLAVHLDNGWDSEPAVNNIANVLRKLDIDLFTYVIDWTEFRDLQLSFLKASVPDAEIPTDHAILAILYKLARKYNTRFILSGHNTATEGGGVASWSQGHGDWLYIKSIHKMFGSIPLKTFPHYGPVKFLFYSVISRIKWIPILDFVEYDKKKAMDVLINKLDWKYYGSKHSESIYTKFYQGYILPGKFGFHKKRLHLSSLVWSGQLTRKAALEEMQAIEYTDTAKKDDKEYVIKKFNISMEAFEKIMQTLPKTFWDYPSYKKIFSRFKWLIDIYHRLKRD